MFKKVYIMRKDVNELTNEELSAVAGGADYDYAHSIMHKVLARFQDLIGNGMSPDSAREGQE